MSKDSIHANHSGKEVDQRQEKVREYLKKHQIIIIHIVSGTLASLIVNAGLPYHQVMKITGHKKLTTLQK